MDLARARRPAGRQLARYEPAAVMTKALLRAAGLLAVPQGVLARIIGVSAATMSRIASGQRLVAPETKEGELALLFLRLFRSLDALLGGNQAQARAWLGSPNGHLGGRPIDLVQTSRGLVHVVDHLDALRGQG